MPFDLSRFALRKISMEVRYGPAFLLWDHVGSIWTAMKAQFPKSSVGEISPNKQQIILDDGLEAATHLDRSILAEVVPSRNLEQFRNAADTLFTNLITAVRITDFSRIGMRPIFELNFDSRQAATEFVVQHVPNIGRQGKFFNVEGGKLVDPVLNWRWEGDTTGCLIKLHSADRRVEIKIPKDVEGASSVEQTNSIVILDVDYYVHASTPVSKFSASAIIENWMKVIRRDVGSFING